MLAFWFGPFLVNRRDVAKERTKPELKSIRFGAALGRIPKPRRRLRLRGAAMRCLVSQPGRIRVEQIFEPRAAFRCLPIEAWRFSWRICRRPTVEVIRGRCWHLLRKTQKLTSIHIAR